MKKMTQMSPRNAQRIAARLELDRPKITEAEVKEYRRAHYPELAHDDERTDRPPRIPGDGYVAKLSHERFHEWFGTECDGTCPHRRSLPAAAVRRAPWWRRLFGASVKP